MVVDSIDSIQLELHFSDKAGDPPDRLASIEASTASWLHH